MATDQLEMTMTTTCPHCSAADQLIPLGERYDYRRFWLRWASSVTYIYLCDDCDRIVELTELRHRS